MENFGILVTVVMMHSAIHQAVKPKRPYHRKPDLWYVYIILCDNGYLYTGIAINPLARFKEHRNGNGAAFTHLHKPVRLLYSEFAGGLTQAMRREREIKSWPRARKIRNLSLILEY